MTTSESPEYGTAYHAENIGDVRKLLKRAKTCAVRFIANDDDCSTAIEVSKAAIRRALAGRPAGEPCGGTLWESDGHFQLCRSF